MNLVLCAKMVPDLVEELELNSEGTGLAEGIRHVLNEFDDQALEQALILKEAHGGILTVLAPDADEVDEALFTALAKGADRVIKVVGASQGCGNRALARALAGVISGLNPELVLTGVQAADDRDGQLGPMLAAFLDVPHVSVVTGVEVVPDSRTVVVQKEYPGGLMGEFETTMPAVLGIQAAPQPPRYASVGKVRQAMKERTIEEVTVEATTDDGAPVRRMFRPVAARQAEILEGSPEEVARRVVEILSERGLLRGQT